jgi:uncharacterized membrane protein YvlD (DUF360 family)
LLIADRLCEGVRVAGFVGAVIAAFAMGVINFLVGVLLLALIVIA